MAWPAIEIVPGSGRVEVLAASAEMTVWGVANYSSKNEYGQCKDRRSGQWSVVSGQ
jgi:hypothetical protein